MDKNITKLIFFILLFSGSVVYTQTTVDLEGISPSALKNKIENNTALLFDRINDAYQHNKDIINYEGIVMTDDARAAIDGLWQMSPFMIQELEIYEKLLRRTPSKLNPNSFEIRNIKIFIKKADEGERNKQAVIDYNSKGEINDFYLAIGYKLYKSVMTEGKSVEDLRKRQIVLNFVENFRTAYNRKDLHFIRDVFSNDALIIVGKTVKRINPDGNKNREETEYIVRSKAEYMERLNLAFETNKYINVQFDDVKVVVHNQYPYMYGVTVKQKWKSDRYGDEGFVFLLIDLRDINKPVIHIRTWDKKNTFNIRSFQMGDY